MTTLWITRLLLSHLVADFVLQPGRWVEERNRMHFRSPRLYLHSLMTGLLAWLFTGFVYWPYAAFIMVSHFLIDGWKSYRPKNATYFLIDQALHLLVLVGCWYVAFYTPADLRHWLDAAVADKRFWLIATGFVFVSFPAGIAIGQLTKPLSESLPGGEGLANAGKWIGILERTLILIFMLQNQLGAIAFLITAKGLLRFSESGRQEEKTEYVLIGTLLSVVLAVATGLLVNRLLQ
jgi:hypothetical protein